MLWILYIITALTFADALTGFIHWLEDQHPNVFVILFGDYGYEQIVKPNEQHHADPFAMTHNTYADRVKWSCIATAPLLAAGLLTDSWLLILTALFASQANQVHYWAHVPKPPAPVKFLQRAGILQGRLHHSIHHRAPHATRFCVMTPWINNLLDFIGEEL